MSEVAKEAVEIDRETIMELHGSEPGAQVDEEWGGWRLEQETRKDDDDWYSHWVMVVSREDQWLVRRYYRGKFRRGLTEFVRAEQSYLQELTFTEVYPRRRTVTVTEYKASTEIDHEEDYS